MAILSIVSKVIDGSGAAELSAVRRELIETNANLAAARIDAQALPDGDEKNAKLAAINDAIVAHREAVTAANATIREYSRIAQLISSVPGISTIPSVDEIGLMGDGLADMYGILDTIMGMFGDIGAQLQSLWDAMMAALDRVRSAASYALQRAAEPFQAVQTGINLGMAAVAVGVGALVIYVLSKAGTKEGRARLQSGSQAIQDTILSAGKAYMGHVKQTTGEAAATAMKVAPYLV